MVSKFSREQTSHGEGIEVLVNEPYKDDKGSGQFTHKRIFLGSYVSTAVLVFISPTRLASTRLSTLIEISISNNPILSYIYIAIFRHGVVPLCQQVYCIFLFYHSFIIRICGGESLERLSLCKDCVLGTVYLL